MSFRLAEMFYLCVDICLLVRRFLPIGSFPIAYWFVFDCLPMLFRLPH